MRQKVTTVVLCSLIIVSTICLWSRPCSANPIAVSLIEDGSAFHNGTFLHMPFADVEINISRTSNIVTVDLFGTYKFETNETQNASLAYVYPSGVFASQPDANMTILVDSVEIGFTILSLPQMQEAFNFTDDIRRYTSIHADFALFETNLIANQTMTMQVFSEATFIMSEATYWLYNYIFGSARTFDGDTWERIHIHLVENTPFFGTSFSPDEHLDETKDGIVTDAIWEFNVSSMDVNKVTFNGQVGYPPPTLLDYVIWTGIITALVIVIYAFVKRNRR